jgi:nitroimidazol reductase NimA-like FMN-containing flavoprotein (pyridoxamine 5'-phosphate oxidase superfamily)
VLGTCSHEGTPWVAPLEYAVDKHDGFYWVSARDAVHSRNIAQNPKVAFVIFDTDPEYGHARGLYCSGLAAELQGQDLEFGCDVAYRMRYPEEAERAIKGRRPVDFTGPSAQRMYRALVTEYSIFYPRSSPEHGPLVDFRVTIPFHTGNVGV